MSGVVRTLAAIACGVLLVGTLAVASLAWRLSRGPLRLDFLTPGIEAALVAPDGTTRVDAGSTALEWDAHDRDLDLRVRDVRLLGPDGAVLGEIPSLAVGLAPAALLVGAVIPRTLEAIGPRVQLVRQQDGRVEVGLGGGPSREIGQLLAGAGGGGARSGLQTIRVRNAEVLVEDRATGMSWHGSQGTLRARRDADGLSIERLAVDVGPAAVVVTGQLRRGAIELETTVRHLPTRLFDRWWPAPVAPAMRRWTLANVSRGGLISGRVSLTGTLTDQAAPRLTLGSARYRLALGGLDVRWREGVPPLTGVGAIVTFSGSTWEVRLARGEIAGVDLVRVLIAPAAGGVDARAALRAPLSKMIALMGRPEMRAVTDVPFRPGEISGGVLADVAVQMPADGGAPLVRASGELRSVSLRRAFRGRNVNARHLDFHLDGGALEMRGEVTIGRAPLQLRWEETRAGTPRRKRLITVKGRLDAEGQRALGVDLGSWLTGPVDVQARLAPQGQGATTMAVQVDLTPASLDVPLINLVKEAGAPASADARLMLNAGKVAAVDDFRLLAAGASLTGKALLGPGETWRSAEATIDMPPHTADGERGHLTIGLEGAGTSSLITATADDAGIVFRAVDAYADATGGQVRLTGTIRLRVPGLPLAGSLTADNFVLTRSPMIAKVAAIGSVGGIIDLLAGAGVPFSELAATFTQRAGLINLTEGIAASPGFAVTARGSIDRARDELSLEGTLVPNYDGLSRLVSEAPVAKTKVIELGTETVSALEFSVSGSLADPYVAAKPATGIPSGALRDLQRLTRTRGGLRKGTSDEDEGALEPASRRKSATRKRGRTRAAIKRRGEEGPAAPGTDTE
jgi:hypothetical protein